MNFKFEKSIASSYKKEALLISGADSLEFNGQEYLIIEENSKNVLVFEIKYKKHCSPFKEAKFLNNILAVGHEEYFYLYNLNTKSAVLKFKVDGYFSKLYLHNGLFYVADACGIRCLNKEGNILWANNNLAIDGVIINKFEDNKIYGIGEQDPPGGWEDFVLNSLTGERI
jgi:hypothetical protein